MQIKLGDIYGIISIAFLLSLFHVSTSYAQSQPYPFKQFPLPLDLPPVTQLYEDHHGFMWLGTQEGLYQFDGIHYTYFPGKNRNEGLGRELITSIIEDRENNLWIGARTGLYKYIPAQGDFEKYAIGDETFPYYVHQENDSCFLAHTIKGIYLFYLNSKHWEKVDVGIEPQKIYAAISDVQHHVWVGTDSIVRKYDLEKKSFVDYPLQVEGMPKPNEKIRVNSLFMDSHGQLWINTWYRGVVKLDTKTGHAVYFGEKTGDEQNHLLKLFNPSMVEDGEGNIWIASHDAGINIYHSATGKITYIEKQSGYEFGLTGTSFGIATDHADNKWVKSDRALHYLSHLSPLPHLRSATNVALPDASFISFLQNDFALVGSYYGLVGINVLTKKVYALNDQIQLPAIHVPEEQSIPDVLKDKNQMLWLASPQGVRKVKYTFSEKGEPIFTFQNLYSTKKEFWPSRLIPINDSTLFVKGRTNTHLFAIFHKPSGTFDYHDVTDSLLINQVASYQQDTLIVGIRNKGLYYYVNSTSIMIPIPWKFRDDQVKIQKPVFYAIRRLQNGTYALSTENYGVILFNPVTRMSEQIDIASIANSNIVFGVEEDGRQNLWIHTSNQLLFYNVKAKSLSKINLSSTFPGTNPYLFIHGHDAFGTFEGGLYQIDIDQLFIRTEKPKLYLQHIAAGDEELPWQANKTITLGYSDNFLNYEFIALDYENPQGLRYWYRIPEISEDWIFLDNRTSISLGRLSPGTYHFSIKASNDAGLWSEEVHAPEIIITPPFWKTWWFALVMIAACSVAITYFVRVRKMKIDSELKLRNQIARDLHDDIGSTLSGIKIFSTIAADMSEENKDLSSLLYQIRDKSDLMMQSMSDIVWSINPAYDSLHDMMIRLKQYMSEMLESQNVEVRFQSHIDLKNLKLDLKYRKDLYLALKEMINNTARHARCQLFSFDIDKQNGNIVLCITDDGIGMVEDQLMSGNGLTNIEMRIKEMGGKLVRQSSPGNGTQYDITIEATAFK